MSSTLLVAIGAGIAVLTGIGAGLGIGAFIQNLDWLKCRAAKIA